MSLLDRLQAARHLDDAALAGIWAEATADGRAGAHPHLAACAHCRSRFAAFTSWTDSLRLDAQGEADDAFPPERLAAQQAQIARRLEAMERPARVIAFPRLGRAVASSGWSPQRWIGAAAAAGLIVGFVAGQLNVPLQLRGGRSADARPTVVQGPPTARSTPPPAAAIVPASFSDEDLFEDVDARHPPARALEAIDALTPRSRDLPR